MTDRVPESQTGDWPWRYRCPQGHSSITLYVERFRCATCGESYAKDRMQDFAAVDS